MPYIKEIPLANSESKLLQARPLEELTEAVNELSAQISAVDNSNMGNSGVQNASVNTIYTPNYTIPFDTETNGMMDLFTFYRSMALTANGGAVYDKFINDNTGVWYKTNNAPSGTYTQDKFSGSFNLTVENAKGHTYSINNGGAAYGIGAMEMAAGYFSGAMGPALGSCVRFHLWNELDTVAHIMLLTPWWWEAQIPQKNDPSKRYDQCPTLFAEIIKRNRNAHLPTNGDETITHLMGDLVHPTPGQQIYARDLKMYRSVTRCPIGHRGHYIWRSEWCSHATDNYNGIGYHSDVICRSEFNQAFHYDPVTRPTYIHANSATERGMFLQLPNWAAFRYPHVWRGDGHTDNYGVGISFLSNTRRSLGGYVNVMATNISQAIADKAGNAPNSVIYKAFEDANRRNYGYRDDAELKVKPTGTWRRIAGDGADFPNVDSVVTIPATGGTWEWLHEDTFRVCNQHTAISENLWPWDAGFEEWATLKRYWQGNLSDDWNSSQGCVLRLTVPPNDTGEERQFSIFLNAMTPNWGTNCYCTRVQIVQPAQ